MKLDNKMILEYSKKQTLLYVEDDTQLRETTSRIFNNYFEYVETAVDGQDALEKIKEFKEENDEHFDLIISDINMPRLSGLDLAKKVLAENENQFIIFISAHNETSYLQEAISIGAYGYLIKPLELNQLKNVLYKTTRIISNQKLEDELKSELKQTVTSQERQLEEFYTTDQLTGLENINALERKLAEATDDIVALININKFHEVNQYYGPDVGDSILIQMSEYLLNEFSDVGEVYRGHNDEFIVLIANETINLGDLSLFMKSFFKRLSSKKFSTSTQQYPSDVSIPVMTTVGIANSQKNKLTNSGLALHYAKTAHQDMAVFNEKLEVEIDYQRKFEIVEMVSNAIAENGIVANFQPIVDNKTQEIVKYESLVRILRSDSELVSPFVFLEIAKKSRLYENITPIMIQQAFSLFKDRKESFSINIEIEDILTHSTNQFIIESVKRFSEPERIYFEIVESQRLEDDAVVEEFMNTIKTLGCKISIDDFGTGYSNFDYLMNLHVDVVKIDGSLIRDIDKKPQNRILVESIVQFSKRMGIKTVAEYVSDKAVYEVVKEIGIDYSQGYYFGKPQFL